MDGNTPQFLSTATAARMLGLSTTLIQSLVDKNELQGWKTRGGHRRISLESVQTYRSHSRPASNTAPRSKTPSILVVTEATETHESLLQHCNISRLAVQVRFLDSITEALLILGSERPDLLVVEMTMPRLQQEKTMAALENFNARGRPIPMVLLTQESELRAAATMSSPIQLVPGPLSAPWLHAYLTGVVTTCRR